ncbi:uncharacterized protein LOC120430382 [Culex pipiens pallens]|uniref:uncharacterized protein LOC120430382 n=1 Tax=Culex pipiens pallens TaxID=42434 RepID=UPI001953D723|nr:uncharacterized protein LOC120430382 [Culex pipiens pallens]
MSKSTGTARITAMSRSSKPATATNHTNTYHEIFDDDISTEKVISETSLLDEMGTISRETSTDIEEGQGVSVTLGEGMVKICIRHTFQPLTWASTRQPPADRRQPEQTGQTNDFNQRSRTNQQLLHYFKSLKTLIGRLCPTPVAPARSTE